MLIGKVGVTSSIQASIKDSGQLAATVEKSGTTCACIPATATTLGGVMVGPNISLTAAGKISVEKDNVKGALGYSPQEEMTEITNQDILDIFNT